MEKADLVALEILIVGYYSHILVLFFILSEQWYLLRYAFIKVVAHLEAVRLRRCVKTKWMHSLLQRFPYCVWSSAHLMWSLIKRWSTIVECSSGCYKAQQNNVKLSVHLLLGQQKWPSWHTHTYCTQNPVFGDYVYIVTTWSIFAGPVTFCNSLCF